MRRESRRRIQPHFLDQISLYRQALAASEIQAIYLADSGGKCRPN